MYKPYSIYVDYDGVLVAFEDGVLKQTGRDYMDPYYGTTEGAKVRTRKLENLGPHFWTRLEPMPDFHELWTFLRNFHPNILTAYPTWSEKCKKYAIIGKEIWNRFHTKVPPNRLHIVVREDKEKYAIGADGRPCVLIDDYNKNIEPWIKKGGIGILHENAVDTIKKMKELGFQT